MLKKIFLCIFFIFIFFLTKSVNANNNVTFIDIDYIFTNSLAGKKFFLFLEYKKKKFENDVKDERIKIENEKKKIINQRNILSKNEYEDQINLLEKKINKFNEKVSKNNKIVADLNNSAKKKFLSQVNIILSDYAKNNSINLILNKNNVLLGNNALDITNEILTKFDKKVNNFN